MQRVTTEQTTQLHAFLDEVRVSTPIAPRTALVRVFDEKLAQVADRSTLFAYTSALYDKYAVQYRPLMVMLGIHVPPHRLSATDSEVGLYVLTGQCRPDGYPEVLAGVMFLPYGRQVLQLHSMYLDTEGLAPYVPQVSLRHVLSSIRSLPLYGILRQKIEAFPVGTHSIGMKNRQIKRRMLAEYAALDSE